MVNKKQVNVSIVAANYNNGRYLNDFISSIDNSTVLPAELIIVDDGSTDDSLEIINSFSKLFYLKLIKFDTNRGFCDALNAGIEAATSKYIMRVDPDDIVVKNRIETQVAFLESHKDIDVVGSNVIYFNDKTKRDIVQSNFQVRHEDIRQEYLNGDHGVQHPTTMIRSSVMKKYRYNKDNVLAEDYEIFAKMINDGHRFANIAEPLLHMRIHGKSAGSNIKYKVIKKTFRIRDEIFKTQTGLVKIRFYYWFMLNYRRYLITNNIVLKPVFIFMAIVCQPAKLFKRIINKKNHRG